MQRFIVHLQYNNDVIISLFTERVQVYTSLALFKAAIIANRVCVFNLKTNRRRCTNKVSNPMSRNTIKYSLYYPAHDCIDI